MQKPFAETILCQDPDYQEVRKALDGHLFMASFTHPWLGPSYVFSVNEGEGGKREEFDSSIWYINIKNLGIFRFGMSYKKESCHDLV